MKKCENKAVLDAFGHVISSLCVVEPPHALKTSTESSERTKGDEWMCGAVVW